MALQKATAKPIALAAVLGLVFGPKVADVIERLLGAVCSI